VSSRDQVVVLVILVGLVMGYGLVSLAIRGISKLVAKSESAPDDREQRYRLILGVSADAGGQEIEAAYRERLAKYDPTAVASMGQEFTDLAATRRKEIVEAYEYLRRITASPDESHRSTY
jgi:preprotein translocase subunit Sec63